MKLFSLLLIGVAIIAGCSSPEAVATKALHEIGNGKYKTPSYGVNFAKLHLNEKLFTDAVIESKLGEDFSKYGSVGRLGNMNWSERTNEYFETEPLFNEVKLVKKEESSMDIYAYLKVSEDYPKDVIESLESTYSQIWKHFRTNHQTMAGLKYENVPCYYLKYKVDNKHIANVLVLKIPQVGYRVGSMFFE